MKIERPLAVASPRSRVAQRELVTVLGIEIETPGAAPRQVARYRPRPEPSRIVVSGIGHLSERLWPGKRDETDVPGFHRQFTLAAAGGSLFQVRDAATSVDDGPDSARASAHSLVAGFEEALAGREAWVIIDPRGVVRDVEGEVDRDFRLRRELASLLAEHVVVFPDQRIGIGARWVVTLAVPSAGGFAKQRVHYRLDGWDGEKLTVHIDGARVMERQPAVSPDVPPEIHAEVLVMKSTFVGIATVSLDRPMPIASAIDVSRRFHGRTTTDAARVQDYTSSFDGHLTEVVGPAR